MFVALLALLLLAATIHALRLKDRCREKVGEIFLLYVLVGYCGFPMIIVGTGAMFGLDLRGGTLAEIGGTSVAVEFLALTFTALAVATVAGLYYRGVYLVGPAIAWALYFIGATYVHLSSGSESLNMGHGNLLILLTAHGLVSVILLVALSVSGLWRRTAS